MSVGYRTVICMTFMASLCVGCSTKSKVTVNSKGQSLSSAESLFFATVEQYHLPSEKAQGEERKKLLTLSAQGYLQLLRQFPNQERWCAQALRSLGNVSVEQDKLDDAIGYYSQVAEEYPNQGWEILQAWKAAADLLFENSRPEEAIVFYQNIVDRFGSTNESQLIQTIVRAAKIKLQDEGP